jgi:hypothetical protein
MAASTTFPEPFITPQDRKRLGFVHKSLAGSRHSDHVALLNAFQLWEEARYLFFPFCIYDGKKQGSFPFFSFFFLSLFIFFILYILWYQKNDCKLVPTLEL